MRLVVASIGVAACIVACASFTGAGGEDAPADAGVDAAPTTGADGGHPFTALDASLTDAGLVSPSNDASAKGDAGSSFCAMQQPTPFFCDDFDVNSTVTSGWDGVTESGQTLEESADQFDSAPRSLHAKLSGQLNGDLSLVAVLSFTGTVTVTLAVLYPSLPPHPTGEIAAVSLYVPSSGDGVLFYADDSGAYFQSNDGPSEYSPDAPSPSLREWHQISFTITTDGAHSVMDATFDGASLWSDYRLPFTWQANTSLTLEVGANVYGVDNGELYIDNVVVTN